MTFGHPDNGIGVVIDDNGDVAVSLTVAGFINADGSQIFEARRAVRFQKVFGPFNAATYCFQSMRMNLHTMLRGRLRASQATVRSKSLVKREPWKAHGTAAVTTPCLGQQIR